MSTEFTEQLKEIMPDLADQITNDLLTDIAAGRLAVGSSNKNRSKTAMDKCNNKYN